MSEQRPDVTKTSLTPAQAADVIRYYDQAANGKAYENGWKPKVPLGHVAVNTTQSRHSIIPNKEKPELAFTEPTLTSQEMSEGLEHLMNGQEPSAPLTNEWPVDPTDEQWDEINTLVDTSGFSLNKAYATVMGIWPN